MRRIPILVVLVLLITGIPAVAKFYTDWLWFKELGYEQVFLRSLSAQTGVTVVAGVVVFALLAGNLLLALRALRPRPFMIATPHGPQTIMMDPSSIRPLALGIVGLVSLLIANYAGGQWETWLYFLNATPFGKTDPILGRDIGFYVFTLPLLEMIQGLVYFVIFLMAAVALAAYVFGEEVGLDATRGVFVSRRATRHLGLLAAVMLLVLAFGAWLQIPQLLTTTSGVVTGATYADVHARMPALWVLVVAALLSAALAVWQALTVGRLWPIAAAAGLYFLVSIGGSAYAAIIQRFVVAPNEQVRETPFIVHNIQATRAAFGLEGVVERPLSGEAHLTRADLERNAATIDNVPLWNDRPLLDTFGQIQEIRTYYDFPAVDNDRYTINGQYRQIMLSARELNSRSLPSRTWINEHLTFTHGYGLTLGPVNEVTKEGLPVLFIKDLPAGVDRRSEGDPAGDLLRRAAERSRFRQDQDRGVRLSARRRQRVRHLQRSGRRGALERLPATDVRDPLPVDRHVLLAQPDAREPRDDVPPHRGARRADRAVPEIRSRSVSDDLGRPLVWMQDVYTTSQRYPYSTTASGVNYIRNSIKVTIDAYHGTTTFHVVDPSDPIAQTVGRIFPELLKPLDAMPEGLRTRLRYPQQIFTMQASMFATFHMTNPGGVLQPRRPVGDPVVRRRRQSDADASRITRS